MCLCEIFLQILRSWASQTKGFDNKLYGLDVVRGLEALEVLVWFSGLLFRVLSVKPSFTFWAHEKYRPQCGMPHFMPKMLDTRDAA